MWQMCEAQCLRVWTLKVLEQPRSHVSLHFDGLRVSSEGYPPSSEEAQRFMNTSTEHIANETAFNVQVVIKDHQTLLQILLHYFSDSRYAVDPCSSALSIGVYLESFLASETSGSRDDPLTGMDFSTYDSLALRLGVHLVPMIPVTSFSHLLVGKYLLYSEHVGCPHAVGVVVLDFGFVVFLHNRRAVQLSTKIANQMVSDATDAATLVLFHIIEDDTAPVLSAAELILLGRNAVPQIADGNLESDRRT